jgi:hypothetical protein
VLMSRRVVVEHHVERYWYLYDPVEFPPPRTLPDACIPSPKQN